MDVPNSVQSCGGIRIRLTCIIPYKSCPLFALCSDPTNCRLCPSTFLISGKVLFSLLAPPPSLSPAVLPGLGMCRCFTPSITTHTLETVRWSCCSSAVCWIHPQLPLCKGLRGRRSRVCALLGSEMWDSTQTFEKNSWRWYFQFPTSLLKASILLLYKRVNESYCYSTKIICSVVRTPWCVRKELFELFVNVFLKKWKENLVWLPKENHGVYTIKQGTT